MNRRMIATMMTAALVMNPVLYGATVNNANSTNGKTEAATSSTDTNAETEAATSSTDTNAETEAATSSTDTNAKTATTTADKETEKNSSTENQLLATPQSQSEDASASDENAEVEDDRRVITLDEAVDYALKNSITLKQVQTKADLAKLISDNSTNTRKDLTDADEQLNSAPYQIDRAEDTITNAESELESAQALYGQGLMPTDVSLGGNTIPKGTPISTIVAMFGSNINLALGLPDTIDPETALRGYIEQQLSQNSSKLESGKSELESKTREYYTSTAKYQAALSYAMSNVSSKLSTSTISSLDPKPIGDLIIKMADTQNKVTSYSVNIYKNQIALLVQNSYYEALKQQKLLEVKEKAAERGKKQYELAEAAYQVGAKSKDDMVIAKTYYDSTIMSAELQRKDYNAALIELKKNMNMDLSEDIKVEEVELSTQTPFDLSQGLSSGRRARLEIRMAEAQVDLYKYLKTALVDSGYSTESNQYREANLLQQEAEIEVQSAQVQVESDIRTSYSTLTSMQKIAQKSLELKKGAEETLEIAKVKYEVGFGYDNALLTSMNLESMSGTMVEVLAAEENLVNIEEKAIEAMDGYNLARLKYLNDIGVLPY